MRRILPLPRRQLHAIILVFSSRGVGAPVSCQALIPYGLMIFHLYKNNILTFCGRGTNLYGLSELSQNLTKKDKLNERILYG